jgi:hypothetical protein
MHSNHLYNLLCQLTQEHKSLWRIKKMYMKDAKACKFCTLFWKKLEKDKEDHCQELTKLIKSHLK